MKYEDVVKIVENKQTELANQKEAYSRVGDLEMVTKIEGEIAENQDTLDKLKSNES